MNRNQYRIVFNALRGQLMVVAENVRAQGKSPAERGCAAGAGNAASRRGNTGLRRPLALLVALIGAQSLALPQALAQVVAYRNAPGTQQPTVLNTSNGAVQVNIQTPSEAGVSHNTYSQFDVDSKGVVLNNSRKGAATQIGGSVGGNPWLTKGTAKVILNEVVSSNPSKLHGAVEVAGDRAEVVIANPAGVEVDGGGFINASRATLSTGKVILKDGAIDSHEVRQGTISIGSNGLDASQTDYAALLARAVKINGALHAKELKIVTGANRISADHKTVTRIEGNGAASEYALDVSELGGMYAGKITMVGTDAGVGVRNAGKISASAGEFILTVDGKLINTGQIVTDGNAELEVTSGMLNQGSAYAKGNINIVTEGTLENIGLIGAQGNATLTARGGLGDILSLTGSSLIAGLTPEGLFIDSGKLTIDAGRRAQANGTNRAGEEIAVVGQVIGIWDSNTSAPLVRLEVIPNSNRRSRLRRDNSRLSGRSEDEADGTLDASDANIYANDLLVMWTDGLLRTDNANIFANRIEIGAYDFSNRAGLLAQGSSDLLTINVPGLIDNTGGTLQGGGSLSLQASGLDNDAGQIGSGGMLTVGIAGHLANGSGTIAGSSGTSVAAGSLDSSGMIDGPVSTSDYLDNSGTINGTATAGTYLANAGLIVGSASAGGSLSNAGSIGGSANAGTTLDNSGTIGGSAIASGDLTNSGEIGVDAISGGKLESSGQIIGNAAAEGDLLNSGFIGGNAEAGGDLTNSDHIHGAARAGNNVDNSGDIVEDAEAGGHLTSSGIIVGNATASGNLDNSGQIGGNAEAGGDLSNSDYIHGGARAGNNVANSGDIVEDVQAGGHLTSSGIIVGNATAIGDVDNSGEIHGNAEAGGNLANSDYIGGEARAGHLTSSGTIIGNATASGNLDNSGNIGGKAHAGGSLSNGGNIYGDTSAGASLGNSGMIGGSASAGANLSNGGSIAGSASAGGGLSNSGGIGGSASAGGSLSNGGSIGGSASAGGSLDNSGGIGGSASASGGLSNSGGIGGSASAGGSLSNSGGIGGSANAGTSLANDGTIGGNASASGHLGNTGTIGGGVSSADLGNTGTIGGSAHITNTLDNSGFIGVNGNATIDAASIKNTGTLGSTAGATTINTGALDNAQGTLQGGDGLVVVTQGKLDNTDGKIQSDGVLAVLDGNSSAKTLDIVNTGGAITGGTAVVIDTATVGRDGSIVSHGSFSASLNGDYTQGVDKPFFEAAGPVSLEFSGTVTNDTVWHNDAGLSVTGAQVINTGEISSDAVTQVHATDGNLTNSGLIQGKQVGISGIDLDNHGGRILGDTLLAKFSGNANNAGGSIDITGASDIRIGGNLNNSGGRIDTGSLSLDVRGDLNNSSAANGPRAGITARDGDLDLNVGGNLTLQSADLNASGDLHGFVLGNILADTTDTGQAKGAGNFGLQLRPTNKVSLGSTVPPTDSGADSGPSSTDLHAGGDLSLIAGGNAHYEGLDITAGGDLTLGAVTGNLTIDSHVVTNNSHTEDTQDFSIGDNEGAKLTTLTDTQTETTTGGQLNAGGTLKLLAGNDLKLAGVDLQAGGDLTILGGHDVNIASTVTHNTETITQFNPNAVIDDNGHPYDTRAESTETLSLKHNGGHLNATGDITIDAGHGNPFNADMVADIQTARSDAGMLANAAAPGAILNNPPGSLTLDGIAITAGTDTAKSNLNLLAAGDISINGASDSTTVTTTPGDNTGFAILRQVQGLTDPLVTTTTANPSGQLTGNNINIRSDQGSLTLGALNLQADQDLSLHSASTTRIDQSTLNAGGDLGIGSIGNVTSTGSDFTATGDLTIISQGHIDISGSSDHQEWGGKNDRHLRDTATSAKLSGNTITLAGLGERVTDAQGDDSKATGSNIHLNHVDLTSTGKTSITATGDITVDPGQNYSYDYKHESNTSGFIAEKTTTTDHLLETTTVLASTVKAGSLDVRAQGDVTITATQFDLKGDSSIVAEGKIQYLAAHNETRSMDESTTSRGILNHEFKRTTDHHDSHSRTALVTSVQSEADVLSHSNGDTTLQGTHIETSGDIRLEAGGNVRLDAVESSVTETQYQEHYDRIKEGGVTPVIRAKDHDETSNQDTTLTGVNLHGDTLTVVAGGSITGTAANLIADHGGDLYALGGNIVLDAGQETHTNRHDFESTSIGYSTVKTDGRTHIAGVNHNTRDTNENTATTTSIGSHLDGGAGKITTHSAGDTLILGSRIEAQAGIDLIAGGKLMLGGSQEAQSEGHFAETGTFLGKGRDGLDYQDTSTTSQATELDTQGNIHLKGEQQIILGNADIKSGGKTFLDTPELVFTAESNVSNHNRQDWDKDRGYTTTETHGKLDESLSYTKFDTQGGLEIAKGTKVSYSLDTHGVQGQTAADGTTSYTPAQYQAIAEQLSTQPGMGYLKDLAGRSDIDWQAVNTAHQKWDYSGQGMTQEGAIVLTIVVAIVTYGAGAELAGATTTTTTATGATVTTTTTLGTVANAGFTSLATSAAVSLANNGGDLTKTLHDLGRSETVKNAAVAMVTAGLLDTAFIEIGGKAKSLNDLAKVSTIQGLGSVGSFDWSTLGQNVAGMVGRSIVTSGVSSVINGTDFEDGLRNGLVGDLAAIGANGIGSKWGAGGTDKNPFLQTVAHGVLGCGIAAAKGGDCKSGAVGGMTESVLGNLIGDLPTDSHGNYSQLTRGLYTGAAVIASSVVADELDLNIGDATSAAQNAATNNRMLHTTDRENAKRLYAIAKEKGLSYSLADIEDALRYSSVGNETVISNIVYNPADPNGINDLSSTDAFTGTMNDKMASGHTNAKVPYLDNGQGGRIQNLGVDGIAKPASGLVDFIQNNTTGYSWDAPNIAGYMPVPNDPRTSWTSNGEVPVRSPLTEESSLQHEWYYADNKAFLIPVVDCPAAGCAVDMPIAWASLDAEDQRSLTAYQAAVGRDVSKGIVTVAGSAVIPGGWILGTTRKVIFGAATGAGFDAIGQYTDSNNTEYRPWQTAIVAVTSGVAAPFGGGSLFVDAGLGALTNGTNALVTNAIYEDQHQSVFWNSLYGGGFAVGGNIAGRWVERYVGTYLPTHVGGPAPNHNLAALLQPTPGYPNPIRPSHIGEFVSTTVGGTTTWAQSWFDLSDASTTNSASANTSTADTSADSSDSESGNP